MPTASTAQGTVPGADEHVLGPGGAVDEVPRRRRRSSPSISSRHSPDEHEEVLLLVLAVVVAGRLAGLEHADVDPELRKPVVALEAGVGAEVAGSASAPRGR